jgi:hypothetical protein
MTTPRAQEIETFLSNAGWGSARKDPLPADASFRRYTRLFDMQRGTQALLMDAPPDKERKTPAFVEVAETLRQAGLSAPEIYHADTPRGLVLLEDFGSASFTHVLARAPGRELDLYTAAGAVIPQLQGLSARCAAPYDAAALAKEIALFSEYWWPDAFGSDMPAATRADFDAAWAEPLAILEAAAQKNPALTLRDFHVDNLFDLPARAGLAQVGLIDFQDAVIGHCAYDLVSLLQDVRRDVAPDVQEAVLAQCEAAINDEELRTLYALYGAQRAVKILGIFIRLDTLYKKPEYRRHLPRTWQRVHMNLQEAMLQPFAQWLDRHIPQEMRMGATTP